MVAVPTRPGLARPVAPRVLRPDVPDGAIIYLAGGCNPRIFELARPDFGVMMQPGMGNRPDLTLVPWAADNGCFSPKRKFSEEKWLRWLDKWTPAERANCLFATAPDVVGDPYATIERSRPFFPILRELGYKVAVVAQDDCTAAMIPWDEIDCLFAGGSDVPKYAGNIWKLSQPMWDLFAEAKARGVWCHMGRVNGRSRIRACRSALVDSVDGTLLTYGPDANWHRVMAWLEQNLQRPLGLV